MESTLWSVESRFTGEVPLDEQPGISRQGFAQGATIKAWWKRIFKPLRARLVVERVRQVNDVESGAADIDAPGNFIEAHSPMLRWLRRED